MLETGPGRWAHPSGALWLPEESAVLLADLHLGYGWAQRRRGELGPIEDEQTPARIAALLDELKPRRVVLLGDIVHAPRPAAAEYELVSRTLLNIETRAELTLVRGNHDRGLERDFARLMVERWETAALVAVHGDVLPTRLRTRHLIAGHWHPACKIKDAAGVRHRLPAFAVGTALTVLPAFSPFSAGLDLGKGIPAEWNQEPGARMRIYAATGQRVVLLGK
jgi:uncharacterized protein